MVKEASKKDGFSEEQTDYVLDLVETVEFPILRNALDTLDIPESLENKIIKTMLEIVNMEFSDGKEREIADVQAQKTRDLGYLIFCMPGMHWKNIPYAEVLNEAKELYAKASTICTDELCLIPYGTKASVFVKEQGPRIKTVLQTAYGRFKAEVRIAPENLLPTSSETYCGPVTDAMVSALLGRYTGKKSC